MGGLSVFGRWEPVEGCGWEVGMRIVRFFIGSGGFHTGRGGLVCLSECLGSDENAWRFVFVFVFPISAPGAWACLTGTACSIQCPFCALSFTGRPAALCPANPSPLPLPPTQPDRSSCDVVVPRLGTHTRARKPLSRSRDTLFHAPSLPFAVGYMLPCTSQC